MIKGVSVQVNFYFDINGTLAKTSVDVNNPEILTEEELEKTWKGNRKFYALLAGVDESDIKPLTKEEYEERDKSNEDDGIDDILDDMGEDY